ncbi:hypothetical protein Tco_0572639 [Tanacetum coccineum]
MKHLISLTNHHNIRFRHTCMSIVEEALTRALIVKQGTHPSLIRVPVTIKILVITNLHSIHRINHNSLTVVRSVEVPIIALIVKPGTTFYEPSPSNNYDFFCFDQPPQYHIDQSPPQNLDFYSRFKLLQMEIDCRFKEMLRPLKTNSPAGESEWSNDFTEVTLDEEQSTKEPLDTFLMGDEVISTILERENDEFIKSSVDDLVLIPRESEVTSVYDDLECSMPLDSPPSPRFDVLGERKVDIDLPFGEHLDTLSTGDREIDFNPRDIETNDLIPVLRVFDEPLCNSDSVPKSYDVTFSNPLFDFNDDYTLCYDNPLFDEEFEDITPESTLVIDESSLLVTPPPASKQLSLREVERTDPFLSLTQSGGKTRVIKTSSFGFHHMPSPRPAAYSPKVVMYCYYHPHLTSGDGFDHEPKMK